MLRKYAAVAAVAALCVHPVAQAGKAEAQRWIDNEFQPSTLSKADQMAAYHFMCNEVRGDARPDNVTEFIKPDGDPMLRQVTTEMDPKTRIAMTFEPLFMGTNAPASHMVYLIEAQGETCKLTIEHYDMAPGQEGFAEGWARLAASLKSYLETGTALKMAS